MSDFEGTFGAGADAADIIDGYAFGVFSGPSTVDLVICPSYLCKRKQDEHEDAIISHRFSLTVDEWLSGVCVMKFSTFKKASSFAMRINRLAKRYGYNLPIKVQRETDDNYIQDAFVFSVSPEAIIDAIASDLHDGDFCFIADFEDEIGALDPPVEREMTES